MYSTGWEYYSIDKIVCFVLKAMEHLQSFINDCDRKTELYKRRLKETQEELSEEANSKVSKTQCLCLIVSTDGQH